jgi:hypothetical protein
MQEVRLAERKSSKGILSKPMQKVNVTKERATELVRVFSSDFALSKPGELQAQREADKRVKQT